MRFLVMTLMAAGLPAAGFAGEPAKASRSIPELEHRLRLIDIELGKLAQTSLNGGVGPIGFRSRTFPDPDHSEWVQVDLGKEGPVDEIVLVPALWRSTEGGFIADGFPETFRILAGTRDDPAGTVVREYKTVDHLMPRIEPFVVPTPGLQASWVRVEALRLSTRAFDGRHIFQLSELLVFDGEVNRALRRPVSTSDRAEEVAAWGPRFVADGILPYVMNAAQGEQSLAFVSRIGAGEHPAISVDLGEAATVSGIRLHAADQSDTVPQGFTGDFGLPRHFQVEGAGEADFSDAAVLLDARITSLYEIGPIMEWAFEETTCRHLRLTALDPFSFVATEDLQGTVIGFAEIEILSQGMNVALGKPMTAVLPTAHPNRSLQALSDGRNLYGDILPLRRWLGELARRHDLEAERPLVEQELALGYAAQKTMLRRLVWVAAILVGTIAFVVIYHRMRARRHEAHIRERIAANLHDNLGANLHAIGLLGDLAKEAVDHPDELVDTVDRIRKLTERTGSAARDCANMLEAQDVCEDLVAEMQRDSDRLLADLEHDFSWEGGEILQRLARRKRIDLYLFYKESLANVIKHSEATKVKTRLEADKWEIRLTITDNGQGFDGEPPAALKRRARLLGAEFRVTQPDSGGTVVALTLKIRKFGVLK